MRKQGTTEWTMSKLMTMILAVFLLVLIIYGVQVKGFGPLIENIEGRYNEALIFLRIRDDGTVTCGDAFAQNIEGVGDGIFYPCENNCSFLISDPKELLEFNRFTIDRSGYFVSKDKRRDDSIGYRFASVESERHRTAYKLLNDTIKEFLESEDISYRDFVDAMDFGSGMTLVFEVDDWGSNTFYEYNGENWRIGSFKDGELRGSRISTGKVKDELWDVYYRYDITWNYKGDGKKNIVLTDFNKNFKNLETSRSDFFMWFESLTEKSKKNGKITIEIEDAGFNTRYFLEKGKWEEYGIIWDSSVSEKYVYDEVFKDHKGKYEIVWYFKDNIKKTIISDKQVKSRGNTDEDKFNRWFDELQNNWSNSKKKQDDVAGKLRSYKYKNVVFEGVSSEVKNGIAHSVFKTPMIYFDSSEGERFGVYYENKKPALYYKVDDSVVSDFVDISNEDWSEFLKINKIYEYFKLRRCGV